MDEGLARFKDANSTTLTLPLPQGERGVKIRPQRGRLCINPGRDNLLHNQKFEIRISKFETNSKIRISNAQNNHLMSKQYPSWSFEF